MSVYNSQSIASESAYSSLPELLDGANVSPESYKRTRQDLEERLYALKETGHAGVDDKTISSALRVFDLYVANRLDFFRNNLLEDLAATAKQQYSIDHEDDFNELPIELKRKWARPLVALMKKQEIGPAGIAIIGYDDERHSSHRVNGEYKQEYVGMEISDREIEPYMRRILMKDGAMIIDPEGKFRGAKIKIDNVSVRKIHPESDNIKQAIGLSDGVGNRNYDSVAASYEMEGTLVLTMCMTGGDIKCFYDGKILCSTDPEEDKRAYRPAALKLVVNQ